MRSLLVVGLLVGLLVGPGYWVYCGKFSGSEVMEQRVYEWRREGVSIGTGSMSLSVGGKGQEKWNVPMSVKLDSTMNPVSFNASVKYYDPKSRRGVRRSSSYSYVLKNGDRTVWNNTSNHSLNRSSTSNSNGNNTTGSLVTDFSVLQTFEVEQDGEYVLDVSKVGGDVQRSVMEIDAIDVEVRRNVVLANMKIVIGGVVILVLSFIGLMIMGKKKNGVKEV